jgi:acetolactate synthase I/II/III large subunit
MTAGTDFLLNALVQEGLTHLFMEPGGLVDPFLPALARHPNLRPIMLPMKAAPPTWPTATPARAAASAR